MIAAHRAHRRPDHRPRSPRRHPMLIWARHPTTDGSISSRSTGTGACECSPQPAAALGRIGLSVSPATIRPVNYAFDDQTQSVVFRSALGSKLREGLSSGTAAFEIDGTDPVDQTGWSVIIVGEAEEVTDPAEIERLEDFELEPWAPGVKTHWVRIRATSASGRRIVHDINYY